MTLTIVVALALVGLVFATVGLQERRRGRERRAQLRKQAMRLRGHVVTLEQVRVAAARAGHRVLAIELRRIGQEAARLTREAAR